MGLLERMELQKKQEYSETVEAENVQKGQYDEIKNRIHSQILDDINANGNVDSAIDADLVRRKIKEYIGIESHYILRSDRDQIEQELYDDIMGYGPLEPLLKDETVTEIMVNGPKKVYVEISGKVHLTDLKFRDDAHVMNVIDRIVSQIGRRVDEASPMVDARLKDGSRVNVVIPPVSLVGPCITIRKFSKIPFSPEKLITFGSINGKMLAFLEACVKGKINIVVSGGTGSGKTTLLNVLSSFIPEQERIVTIEDAAEIQLAQEHVVTLECRPANIEGKGRISVRDLVRNSLRMRPDRIIVGEVRSGEALDMLQAMNTGHDGSLTTIHANTPRDSLARIETMVLMAGMELPVRAIREQVASAIEIVIQQSRLPDGSRKVTSISEIVGMEGDMIMMHDIFKYIAEGNANATYGQVKGGFVATGIQPKCLEKLKEKGVLINDEWFS